MSDGAAVFWIFSPLILLVVAALALLLLAGIVFLFINWQAVLCVLFYAVFGLWLFCTVCEKLGIGKKWFT